MGAESTLNLQAINLLRAGPSFRRAQNDHGPAGTARVALLTCGTLDRADLLHRYLQCGGHGFVHQVRLVTLDKHGGPTTAAQELLQFLAADASEDGRIGDLVAV